MTQLPVQNSFIYAHSRVGKHHSSAMVGVTVLLTLLPAWAACSGEGNIRLLQEEVAVALKACTNPDDVKESTNQRQRRSDDSYDTSPRIDDGMKQVNAYSHKRRNSNDTQDQVQVSNATDHDYKRVASGNKSENLLPSVPWSDVSNTTVKDTNRTRRSEPLFNKPGTDQCLSQCVFANLQVVDSRGIPREAELWNKVQTAVTSQQSRTALRDQIRACFQELQSEEEDNGCSYSNKLERCLMLRFSDRRPDAIQSSQQQGTEGKPTA